MSFIIGVPDNILHVWCSAECEKFSCPWFQRQSTVEDTGKGVLLQCGGMDRNSNMLSASFIKWAYLYLEGSRNL